jgi:proteasome lid subunit RPN8/RPN11
MNFYILQKDWKKVIDYAQASYDEFKSEIGGFMIAKRDKDGDIIVSNPEILKQEVTGSATIMDKISIADYYVKSAQAHGTDIRFIWWHSHADMGAFWSGTDTETMKEYSKGDWSAFLVVNIRGEYKFRICVWNPIEAYKDTELNILNAKPKVISKTIKDSVSKLCSKPVTAITTNNKKWDTGQQTSLYNQYWC